MSEDTKQILNEILQNIMTEIYSCHIEAKMEGMEICYEIVEKRL